MNWRLFIPIVVLALPMTGCGDDDDFDDFDASLDAGDDAGPDGARPDGAPPTDAGPGVNGEVVELLSQSYDAQLDVNRALLDPELGDDAEALRGAVDEAQASQQQALELAEQAAEQASGETETRTRSTIDEQEAMLDLMTLIAEPEQERLPLRFEELRARASVALSELIVARQTVDSGPAAPDDGRVVAEDELEVTEDFQAELLANELVFPSAVTVADDGTVFIAEAGFAYGSMETQARLLRVSEDGTTEEVAADFEAPIMGLAFHENGLFVAHRQTITRLDFEDGTGAEPADRTDLVTDLPETGDFLSGNITVSEDGIVYFGQGAVTNSGVVGLDNYVLGWLRDDPEASDIPCRDLTLTGESFETGDPRTGDPSDIATTGPFQPFGEEASEGQVVEGQDLCTGAIYRMQMDGSELDVFADGFRNPRGLGFFPDGRLFATETGPDLRGSRPLQARDFLFQVNQDQWYGYPDFFGGEAVTDDTVTTPQDVEATRVLEDPPEIETMPALNFDAHSTPTAIVFSSRGDEDDDVFAPSGTGFVAQFGDLAPFTTGGEPGEEPEEGDEQDTSRGAIIRIESADDVTELLTLGDGDDEGAVLRPVDIAFSPDENELYVVHFGDVRTLQGAIVSTPQTGSLIRIRRQ